MGNDWEAYLAIGWLAIWFVFPLGMFLSVHNLDQQTDGLHQVARLASIPDVREAVFSPARKEKHVFHVNFAT